MKSDPKGTSLREVPSRVAAWGHILDGWFCGIFVALLLLQWCLKLHMEKFMAWNHDEFLEKGLQTQAMQFEDRLKLKGSLQVPLFWQFWWPFGTRSQRGIDFSLYTYTFILYTL